MTASLPPLPLRRRLLLGMAAAPLLMRAPALLAAAETPRALDFLHTHTDEKLSVVYFDDGRYVPDALAAVNRLLRDFRTGERYPMDPVLLDILHDLRTLHGGGTFEIVSAYRSPATNANLAEKSGGVARNSLHMQGKAIDVRVTGRNTAALRDAAIALARGGVGFYPRPDFVHLDTGRVRRWGPQKS
ncbi:MAG: DUF882 domain-containing protein [Burkholderiales bacterium]|nr:DUF882 domain-containing protein [Burkholderiales bacterium]